ncbi:MAG: 50S ribosomal protein L31e [Candidatus Aenigmarchaeota archaeon]|nr:50S ribosomal protein L31e [Candidatus Aenigmarchaeota archaeon]
MVDEKIYTIPLGDVYIGPKTKRAKKAIGKIRSYLTRHMKAETIKIGDTLNRTIWARGIQKPPRKIRIHAIKENDIVYAELIDVEIQKATKEDIKQKEEKEKQKKEKIKEERKERKSMTMKEEIDQESGKTDTVKDKPSKVETKEADVSKEEHAKESSSQKQSGKA